MRWLGSDDELWIAVRAERRLVVHFGASWNATYDFEIQRRLALLVPSYRARIAFAQASTDDESFWPDLRVWRVLNLPALVLFARGRHVFTLNGLRHELDLAHLFDTLATSPDDTDLETQLSRAEANGR